MWNPTVQAASSFNHQSSNLNHKLGAARVPLRTVSAVEYVCLMRGRTRPSLLRCNDGKYYVVKFLSRCSQPRALANEMLAGRLAILLGLPVCEPVIVDVPRALNNQVSEAEDSARSASLEYGSAFPGPLDQMLVTDFLPGRLLTRSSNATEAFLGAFVFDLWTCNSGRREAIFSRPAGNDGSSYSVWLIDHDACFNDGNWSLPETRMPSSYAQGAVYRMAKGVDSFEPFLSRIENLRAKEIEGAARSIPTEWCGGNLRGILDLTDQLFHRRKQVRQATVNALRAKAY
jgi:HipA-like kinase